MIRWTISARVVGALALGVLGTACGSDDADDPSASPTEATSGSGSTTPGPITTREGQTPESIDTDATPDPVDPDVVSTAGLDAQPDTPEIDTSGTVSGEFEVAFTVTELGLPMVGYQFDIDWDNEDLEFVGMNHLETGGLTFCPSTVQLGPQRILGACAQPQLQSTDTTGQFSLITFRCTAPGETTLHLRYQQGSFNTKIETVLPEVETSHTLILSDAKMTCS